jgi:arabinose-5-phosphate isomerase
MTEATDTRDAIGIAREVLAIEIAGLEALSSSLGTDFSQVIDLIGKLKGRLICAGVGKSGHVARKIAATLASTGTPAQFIHPTEASHGDMGMISTDDAILILSKSGEAPELGDLIAYSQRFDIPLIAMTAKAGSGLGRAADHVLLLPDAPEACGATFAPTTSTTMQIALGDCLAVALIEQRGFTAADFRIYHPGGKLGAMLKTVADLMHQGDEIPLVSLDTPMMDALLTMTAKRFGCTGVVNDDGVLVGIITDGDVRRKASGGFMGQAARDLMTPEPMVIAPQALAAEALNLLNSRGRTVLLSVDQDHRPVGILHIHDLLRAGIV